MGNTPYWFRCYRERKQLRRDSGISDHAVHRTGRKKENPSRNRSVRTLGELHEYVCSCGHRGWTNHMDILHRPIRVVGDYLELLVFPNKLLERTPEEEARTQEEFIKSFLEEAAKPIDP